MLNVIMGMMGSGKSTLVRELKKLGYKDLVSYTTRPMREGEKFGKDYYFVREKIFKELEELEFFIETREYKTKEEENDSVWFYGLPWDEYLDKPDGLVILDLDGTKELINKIGKKNVNVIYLKATIEVLRDRVLNRGDNTLEIERRLEDDLIKFANAENYSDLVIDCDVNLDVVVERVLTVLK